MHLDKDFFYYIYKQNMYHVVYCIKAMGLKW